MPLTGYEETSVVEVGAVLDTSPATAEEVYLRTIGHSERAIAAVAAKRTVGGSGSPFQIVRIPFTYQTPNLVNPAGDAAVLYQPDAGTVFDFRIYITEAFDNYLPHNSAAVVIYPRGDQSGDFATFAYDWANSNSELTNEPGLPLAPELRFLPDAVSIADCSRHHFYASGDCDVTFVISQLDNSFSPQSPTQGTGTMIVITYPFAA